MKQMLRAALVAAMLLSLWGCKIGLAVFEGGDVMTVVGTNCFEGDLCIYEVTNTEYGEVFAAMPKPGWRFLKWNAGDSHLCANSVSPVCSINNRLAEGVPFAEAVIASNTFFYLVPVFTDTVAPITDTQIVNGVEWAQPDLFVGLSWDDINGVCPSGACITGGVLNGYDVSGWTWASPDDVNELYNDYLGIYGESIGPGPDQTLIIASGPAFTFFYNDGWRPTEILPAGAGGFTTTQGYTNTLTGALPSGDPDSYLAGITGAGMLVPFTNGTATIFFTDVSSVNSEAVQGVRPIGAWFFRPAPPG